jgi:hypothetical protein
MSNHLAVAGVTAALVKVLEGPVSHDMATAEVVPGRPDDKTDDAPRVLVFLVRVEPNAAWRNADLPTRSPNGSTTQRPQAALTLDYLLTFVGKEAEFEPQRLLGTVTGALHFHPLLSRDDIAAVGPTLPGGGTLDLADQPELVRFAPLALSLDELSTLWSAFFQTPYRLSVAYRADVVLLTPPSMPVTPLPVRERRVVLTTIRRPELSAVVADAGADAPIVVGTPLRLDGTDLRGDERTVVRFGDTEATPTSATSTRIVADVPAGVRAGVVAVVVEHRRAPQGTPAGRSNAAPVVVRPRIRRDATQKYLVSVTNPVEEERGFFGGTLDLTVDPPVAAGQEVSVLLDPVGGGRGVTFLDDRRDAPADPPQTSELHVPFTGLAAGSHLVRVVVSGAVSPLDVAANGTYDGPQVSVP